MSIDNEYSIYELAQQNLELKLRSKMTTNLKEKFDPIINQIRDDIYRDIEEMVSTVSLEAIAEEFDIAMNKTKIKAFVGIDYDQFIKHHEKDISLEIGHTDELKERVAAMDRRGYDRIVVKKEDM